MREPLIGVTADLNENTVSSCFAHFLTPMDPPVKRARSESPESPDAAPSATDLARIKKLTALASADLDTLLCEMDTGKAGRIVTTMGAHQVNVAQNMIASCAELGDRNVDVFFACQGLRACIEVTAPVFANWDMLGRKQDIEAEYARRRTWLNQLVGATAVLVATIERVKAAQV